MNFSSGGMLQTCLSQSHKTCWGPSAYPLQSGIASGRSAAPPGPQSRGSVRQHRPASWTRSAATAGKDAGSCLTAAEGSAGSWGSRGGGVQYIGVLVRTLPVVLTVPKTSAALSSAQ